VEFIPHCFFLLGGYHYLAYNHVLQLYMHLSLPGSLALGAQHGKLDADLRTFALLGTPSVQTVNHYSYFVVEDGGRLAPMAVAMVDRLATLVAVRRFHGMDITYSCSLRNDRYVRMYHFGRRTTYVPFRRFLGDVRREFMHRLSTALHGTLGSCLLDALACLYVPRA
jgi:hypothetical protein